MLVLSRTPLDVVPGLAWRGPVPPAVQPPAASAEKHDAKDRALPRPAGADFLETITVGKQVPWYVLEDDERSKALGHWRMIVSECPGASRLGAQLLEAGDDQPLAVGILQDTFEGKATATLKRRASSVLLYLAWHRGAYPGEAGVPFAEKKAYAISTSFEHS